MGGSECEVLAVETSLNGDRGRLWDDTVCFGGVAIESGLSVERWLKVGIGVNGLCEDVDPVTEVESVGRD